MSVITPQNAPLRTYLGYAPGKDEGAKFMAFDFTFDGTNDIEIPNDAFAQNGEFTTVQSMWFENPNNGQMRVQVRGSRQVLYMGPQTMGMLPIIGVQKMHFVASHDLAGVSARIILLNVPQPYFVTAITA